MELLNTLVSAYCGLLEGQIGNINLTHEDYQQIDKEEMDLMDIKWAFASAVRRAKDFMERTGRTSLESKKDTKYGFDKQAVKCFNCGERGHFKRECTKPAQHGNQNPFRNQGNQRNQNRNNERTLIPVNNPSQAGPSNANQALVVQIDEGCDWSIQLGNDTPDGTACFAEVVKDLKRASGGESSTNGDESSEDEDSISYSRSSDEESSNSGDDHLDDTSSVSVDADVDELLEEAAAGNHRRSILVDQAAYSSSSLHSAFMANVDSSSSQVCVDELTVVKCDNCASLSIKCADLDANMSELQGKHDALKATLFDLQDKHVSLNAKWCDLQSKHEALQNKYDVTFIHNQKLTVDLSKCTEANMFYENHEKEFKSVIEKLKKDKTELTKMVSRKQTDINLYINRLEIMQKEMACVKTKSEAIQLKLDSYLSSSYVLDHIIDVQKEKKDVTCIGYKKCPPPVRHNYDAMPDEEDRTYFEPSVPLDVEEFATGLGYKKEVSSDSDVSADTSVSSAEQNQDPPVIVEDADSSDDESDDTDSAKSDAVIKEEDIPLENHILCDPPAKSAKTVPIESSSAKESESVNLLYTLVGDDKIYSDKDFPIKNVNRSLISKIFEDSTSKFLGKTGSHVVVTQCPPIPKAEVRKQYGNQKLPTMKKQQNHTKPKGKSPTQGQKKQSQKKDKKVNFVKSKGTDKIETFENKSNLDFVKQAKVLKRNDPNSSKPSTSGSQSSSSTIQSHGTSGFVERRSCFECGEIGHIIRNCPYLHKLKAKVDDPCERNYQKRSVSAKQDPCLVREREKKQKRQQVKVIEKALKTEVVQKQSVPVKPESSKFSKTSNNHEVKFSNNQAGETQQTWKPKMITNSGGSSPFPNHQKVEVIVVDENGRPKTTMAWVPISN
ncbi:putative transcription factor interactor and regulator CCHC(Zn) family [Helianthus annuus]|nr:putative transcription factor interactor and regulator CCHC(Zn) family [Helianthus annuus]